VPSARTLSVIFLIALGVTVLFAFTLIGLVGEAVAALALVGLLLRGVLAGRRDPARAALLAAAAFRPKRKCLHSLPTQAVRPEGGLRSLRPRPPDGWLAAL
jgi:hypothetical protein